MRVLILSTATGQGHNSSAHAVKEYLDKRGVDAKFFDVLNTGRQKSRFISKLYDGMVRRTPFIFGALYSLGERISSPKRHSPIYYLNTLYVKSLYQRIQTFDPQVIVCPHLFSAQSVTRLIEKYGLSIPTVGIITDYTCSPFWEETRLDICIVANQAVANECVDHGMDPDKMAPIGIPVSERFSVCCDKREARKAFGVDGDETVFTIMGGSMGYGNIPELASELLRLKPDARIIAVCGNNEPVYEKVRRIPNVIALPYIDDVDVLMDATDVLLTKPGGLSTTEAMTKRVPLVITNPIPGGEVRNSQMIASMDMALLAYTVPQASRAACDLASDVAARAKMKAAQVLHCSTDATSKAGELIIKLASGIEFYTNHQ